MPRARRLAGVALPRLRVTLATRSGAWGGEHPRRRAHWLSARPLGGWEQWSPRHDRAFERSRSTAGHCFRFTETVPEPAFKPASRPGFGCFLLARVPEVCFYALKGASDLQSGRAPWPSLPDWRSPCVRSRAALGPWPRTFRTFH